jgi:hypothetical protein
MTDLTPRTGPTDAVATRRGRWMPMVVLGWCSSPAASSSRSSSRSAVDYYCNVDEIGERERVRR